MARPRKKPEDDAQEIMDDLFETLSDSYNNSSSEARKALHPRYQGEKTSDIAATMGIAPCTMTSLLPYEKAVYNLDEISTEAERTALYHARKGKVEQLAADPTSLILWQTIILFQGYPFVTSGWGRKPGVEFSYSISEGGAAGKHYEGKSVEGYGNELLIKGRERSISRSSVDYALGIALKGDVTGPKQLKVYGSSYIYAIFKRFGLV